APEGVPLLDPPPDVLSRILGSPADRGQVDAGNDPIAHAHDTIDDDGHDIVADPALYQSLDRVADRPEAEAVARLEIDHHDVGLGTWRQTAQVRAPECPRAAERRGLEHLPRGSGRQIVAHDLAEIGRDAHLHDEIARIRVAAQGHVDAGRAIL